MVSFQNLKFGAPTITRVYEEIRIENKFRENQIINNDFKSIKFENITYSYNNDQNIIEDTSITINKGEFIGIKGLSGSGKTTILNIILDLLLKKWKNFVDEKCNR